MSARTYKPHTDTKTRKARVYQSHEEGRKERERGGEGRRTTRILVMMRIYFYSGDLNNYHGSLVTWLRYGQVLHLGLSGQPSVTSFVSWLDYFSHQMHILQRERERETMRRREERGKPVRPAS